MSTSEENQRPPELTSEGQIPLNNETNPQSVTSPPTNVLRNILTSSGVASSTPTSASATIPNLYTSSPSTSHVQQPQYLQAPVQLQPLFPSGSIRQQPFVFLPAKRLPTSNNAGATTFTQPKIKIQGCAPNQKAPSHLVPVNPQSMYVTKGQLIQILPYSGAGMMMAQTPTTVKSGDLTSNGVMSNGLQTARVAPQLVQMLPSGVFRQSQTPGGPMIYAVSKTPSTAPPPRLDPPNLTPAIENNVSTSETTVKKEIPEEAPPTLIPAAIATETKEAPIKRASIYDIHFESAMKFRDKRGPSGIIKHLIDGIEIEESDGRFPLEPAHKILDLVPENLLKKTFPHQIKRIEKVVKKRGRPLKVKEETGNEENQRFSNVLIDNRNLKGTKKIKEEPNNDETMSIDSAKPNDITPPQRKRQRVTELDRLKNFDFGPKEQGPRILETLSRSEDKKQQSIEKEIKDERSTRKSRRSTETPTGEMPETLRRSNQNRESIESSTIDNGSIKEKERNEYSIKIEGRSMNLQGIPMSQTPNGSTPPISSPSTSTAGLGELYGCTFCQRPFSEAGRLKSYPQFCSKRCVKDSRSHGNHSKRPQRSQAERDEHMRNVDSILSSNGSSSSSLSANSCQSGQIDREDTNGTDDLRFVDILPLKNWETHHVYTWIRSVTGSEEVASLFRSEEIDGDSLSMVKNEDLRHTFNMKLGPALKLGNSLEELKIVQKKFKSQ